ncbi:MAG: PA14 domain-containing protein [Phycisphaeraceae bacterium]
MQRRTGARARRCLTTLMVMCSMGWAHAEAPHTLRYELEDAGRVSMAVYDARGRLVRELMRGETKPAGAHQIQWDGLDRAGRPVPPGEYEWRLLRTPGLRAEYITTLGTDTPGPPDDDWVGNHGPLRAVLCDGQRIYIGTLAENVPCHIAMPIDGSEVLWRGGIRLAHGGSRGMGLSEGILYDLRITSRWDRPRLFGVDPDTGERLHFFETEHFSTCRMDVGGGFAVVAYEQENVLHWHGVGPGLTEQLRIGRSRAGAEQFDVPVEAEVTVDAPVDVAVDDRGRAYAITDGAVARIERDGARSTVIAREALTHPYRIAWVPQRDELLIAERDGSHRIKRFALPSGERIDTYGKPGGRDEGPYDPLVFHEINDVAPDGHGGFIVIEGGTRSIQRTARFTGDGKLMRQWFGPQRFFNHAMPDPDEPTRVFINGGYEARTELKVDYDTGAWRVVADYRHPAFGDGLFPEASGAHRQWHVRHRGGETYFVCDAGDRFAVVRLDAQRHRLVPVAVGGQARHPERKPLPEPLEQAIAHHDFELPEQTWRSFFFTWSDRDGDGEIEPEEFILGGDGVGGRKVFVDAQWNVYAHVSPEGERGGRVRLLASSSDDGAPVWDGHDVRVLPGDWPREFEQFERIGSRGGVYVDAEGAVYRHVAANSAPWHDRPAPGWPTNMAGVHRFMKWSADGELMWSVGRQASISIRELETPQPGGHFHQPCAILGRTHGCIVMADRVGLPATAWTVDGLYAGSFLDRRADDGLHPSVYHWWRAPGTSNDGPLPYDMLTGGSIVERGEDEVLWFPMGRNESPVYRITGWTGWQRQRGAITVTEPAQAARGEGTGVRGEYFDNAEFAGTPRVTRRDERLWFSQRQRARGDYTRWTEQVVEGIAGDEPFSVRWTGRIEAPLSEPFVFHVFNIDNTSATMDDHWRVDQAGVRVWLDGELILEQWAPEGRGRRRPASEPIALEAGRTYDLRIEYAKWGDEVVGFSLVWGSFSRELHRVPGAHLYPPP